MLLKELLFLCFKTLMLEALLLPLFLLCIVLNFKLPNLFSMGFALVF